jgi:DNA replication licensing factor MCM4
MPKGERTLGINMRELNPQGKLFLLADIDKLVTVKGLVIRCTPIIPDMKIGELAEDSSIAEHI